MLQQTIIDDPQTEDYQKLLTEWNRSGHGYYLDYAGSRWICLQDNDHMKFVVIGVDATNHFTDYSSVSVRSPNG